MALPCENTHGSFGWWYPLNFLHTTTASELARERFSANSAWICFFFASSSCCCAEITSFFAASEASADDSSRSMAEGVRRIFGANEGYAREFLLFHE